MAGKSKAQDKNKVSEIDDQIYKNFEIKKRLGKGAYGIVWKAIDKKSNNVVAVKKIFDAFRNETDAQRTFREIMFLKAFKDHPNVIQLYSIHKATNNLDIYLAFEFMESDLHNVIKRGTILKDIHKRYVMYQLFNAVKYIHSGNVIHRDLKPSNVLIDSKCRCKIADFGLARSVSNRPAGDSKTVDPTEPILTDYVATRWYRAPEILIASKRYTKGIDMWSLGCILGEMIRGKPLFPGSSTVNQIEKIVASLPEINEKDIEAVGAGFGSVLLNQPISSENNPRLDELLSGSTEDAKQLVKTLLMLNPAERLTAKEALTHRYIEKFKNSITEAELNSDVLPPFRDDIQLTVPEYRSKLYEIMQTSETKGTEKSSNSNSNSSSGKTTSKTTVRRKETPKLDSTITVTATSKQSSIKISPSKLEDKSSKKEYNHTRFTEKKYQSNSISTSTNTNHHQNTNNNSNSNNSHNNNNVNVNSNSNSNSNFNGINTTNNGVNNSTNNGVNNTTNNGISISNTVKPPSNTTAGRKQFIIYKETAVSNRTATNSNSNTNINNNNHNINNNNSNNNNNNNSNNYNSSGSNVFNNSNLLSNDAKLLKPLSKLKHFKLSSTTLPSEKPKMLSSPSSVEYSSSVLDNGNSKYRNINNFEKRHSIDCTYHPQGISPNKHQSNTSAKSGAKNGSFSNLNTLNTTKGLLNKTAYNNRLALEREKVECSETSSSKNNQLYHHGYRKKSDLMSDTLLPSSNSLLNDTNDNNCSNNNSNNNNNNNSNNNNNNYYEKRLKLLEEKIQKQKLDIKALFSEKEKNKIPKPALDLNDYKTNDNNNNIKHVSNSNSSSCNINNHSSSSISRKLTSSYTISENNQDKYLRSKFTIAHQDKIYNNKRNTNTINRTQIPIKYDIGHPDGNNMINLKEKNFTTSYENNNTNNIRKTQSIIS